MLIEGPKPRGKVRLNLHETSTRALRFRGDHFNQSSLEIDFTPIQPLKFRAPKSSECADRHVWNQGRRRRSNNTARLLILRYRLRSPP